MVCANGGWSCPPGDTPLETSLLWQVTGDGWAVPTFDSTAAYFPGLHHEVIAVDKGSGKVLWQQRTPPVNAVGSLDTSLSYGYGSAMAGGSVIVMDYALSGFAPQTGSLRWTFTSTAGTVSEISVPGSNGQSVYQGTSGGYVFALDGATGSLTWQSRAVNDDQATVYSPVPAGGDVYAGFTIFPPTGPNMPPDSGGTVALDAATGAVKWTFYFPRAPTLTSTPRGWDRVAIAGSYVIAASEQLLYALDRTTGTMVWQGPPADLVSARIGAVAAQNGRVFVGFTSPGYVVALDATTGRELWRFTGVQLALVRNISTDDEHVFVSYAGPFVALDAATGAVRWQVAPTAQLMSGAAVDSDRIYVSGGQGYYAFRK